MSIFNRLNITRSDGSPVVLKSHQLRRWLNTIVDRGLLSELEIAMWSGRKDVRQNKAYDYTPADDILARYREIDTQFGDFVVRVPVSQKDFDKLGKDSAIHATQMGFCRHPYSVSPCEKHRDCANCGEHCIIKGIPDRDERIRRMLGLTRQEVAKAEAELADKTYGANRWLECQRGTLARLENLVEILDDPSVPVHAVITLKTNPAIEYSPLRLTLENRQYLLTDKP
jgi:hypothetical protein